MRKRSCQPGQGSGTRTPLSAQGAGTPVCPTPSKFGSCTAMACSSKRGAALKCATSANSASCPFLMCLSLHISFNYFLLPPWIKTGPYSFLVPKHRVCHLWQHVRRFCAKRQTKALQWLCHSTLPHVSIYTKYSMVCSLPSWGRVLPWVHSIVTA